MEYNWSNQSCKKIEAKSKQADYQSELARDMHNFHHGSDNGFNAYGGNNHGNPNFTPGRHFRVEFSEVNDLPQAQEVVDKSIVLHVEEEAFNEELCDFMSGKNQEKERVEEKERLVERLCIFYSICIILKESENFESSKEKESELKKMKVEQREKEIVVLEKSKELNLYANETNSFLIQARMKMESLPTSPSRSLTSFPLIPT
ncbi:hypothetical protein M9H77_08340 [Catharanthus roseus]|uniref:Uncharacterized protein n=1 Tax=Catharanthus roseus TaxID=4058 RepID=A0ACC0BXJ5_CATRO|nr:hypothetical protein M9H77_08340 [Catharanthus roseus]